MMPKEVRDKNGLSYSMRFEISLRSKKLSQKVKINSSQIVRKSQSQYELPVWRRNTFTSQATRSFQGISDAVKVENWLSDGYDRAVILQMSSRCIPIRTFL